ncbi:MAG: hypothetical protein GY796_11470 [Chloroflexi bacterium]|nr:hypothetical protein [Chloroflexota bacterium]
MAPYVDPIHLRQVLTQYYNEGELRTLCFDLTIDYESLGGQGKANNVRALVAYAQNRGRLNEIAAYVRRTRPHVQLKMTDTPPPMMEVVEQSQPSQGTTHVYNAPVYQQGEGGTMTNINDNRESGDNITVGNISNSSGVAIGSDAASTVSNSTTGDTFNMSGDFRGANLNIKSTLTDVTQSIGALPHADDATKAELERLITELNETLQKAPEDRAEEAEAVAEMAKTLVETASAEKPNKTMLQISGEGLKQAAKNIADIMPTVLGIATKIAAVFL